MNNNIILVTGAGGFIGGHLVDYLIEHTQASIRAVDKKPFNQWYKLNKNAENIKANLMSKSACERVSQGVESIYNLAADMGGIGFIEGHKAQCMLSVMINTNLLLASIKNHVERYFYSSSACVYSQDKQMLNAVMPLKESDAYPASPEDGYGWEKLFSERMCRHFKEDFGLITRVARYHNVYGPYGTYKGGREKAPAALCRKVILAKLSGKHEIEIWGDGEQTRSFMYIDDCCYGTYAILKSTIEEPINLGTSELISINGMVDLLETIAHIKLKRLYNTEAPVGVRGRNSDNTLIKKYLDWEPSVPLKIGLEKTYSWIYDQMVKKV